MFARQNIVDFSLMELHLKSFSDEVGPVADRPPGRRAVPERGDAEAGAAPPHQVVRVHRAGLLYPEGR